VFKLSQQNGNQVEQRKAARVLSKFEKNNGLNQRNRLSEGWGGGFAGEPLELGIEAGEDGQCHTKYEKTARGRMAKAWGLILRNREGEKRGDDEVRRVSGGSGQ